MSTVLEFQDVDVLFPGREDGSQRARLTRALAALDGGATRADIAKETGVTVGVAGANLRVKRGEISVLMGLSGSGKSTLLRAANRLAPATRGKVLMDDGGTTVDVASCDADVLRQLRRRRIAMVFQQFGLLPWRTVRENVGFGLELRGESLADRRRIVDEKLELVGLSAWSERYVRELSGGMQQRVGLARAFATDPELLLMDEPFSALDPLIRGKLQDELLSLQERVKKSILFVSHDLDEALKLGDTITIMEGGRIVQSGTATDIVLRPADDYVAEFVRHMNPLTVLTGDMIMMPAGQLRRDGGTVWLDAMGRRRLELDSAGFPTTLRLDNELHTIGPAGSPGAAVWHADSDLSLKEIIDLHHKSGHPIMLVERQRWVGVCGEAEILRALAGQRGRPDGNG